VRAYLSQAVAENIVEEELFYRIQRTAEQDDWRARLHEFIQALGSGKLRSSGGGSSSSSSSSSVSSTSSSTSGSSRHPHRSNHHNGNPTSSTSTSTSTVAGSTLTAEESSTIVAPYPELPVGSVWGAQDDYGPSTHFVITRTQISDGEDVVLEEDLAPE